MTSSVASNVSESSLRLVGRLLDGRYRVLSHLADGGMATVYLALDERLDREVAVKVMHDNLARDTTFVSRFRREARSEKRSRTDGDELRYHLRRLRRDGSEG